MVKQLTFLKSTFYKNNTAECGAQTEAIKNNLNDNIIVHSQTKKLGRIWGNVEPSQFLNIISKNHGIYEVITKFPHKVYFDIDADDLGDLTPCEQSEHLASVLQKIENILPNADAAVSGSYTSERVSYHVILNNYTICNEKDRVLVKGIAKQCGWDWKVYTKNRNMKCINQSKDDGRVQAILTNPDMKKHMITCFFNNHTNWLPFPTLFEEKVQDCIMIEQAKVVYNVGQLPKINLPTPKNLIFEELTALDVLALLPLKQCQFDFAYKHRVARFCHTNELSFDVYLNWLATETPNIQKTEAGNKLWSKLHNFPPCTIQHMEPILRYYYPTIKQDVHFRQFTDMFRKPDGVKQTRISRLDQCHYNQDYKASVFHLGMGCGKTAQTIDYLKKSAPHFVWIGHRQSLHKGTYQRMMDAGLSECVDYSRGSAQTKPLLYSEAKQLSICLPSLKHLGESKYFDTIVIDEIESILDQFTGKLLNERIQDKKIVLSRLIGLVRHARKVILLDAFVTDRTISFLKSIDSNMSIDYVYKDVVFENTVLFKTYKTSKDDPSCEGLLDSEVKKYTAVDEICDLLIAGKKSFVYYPIKKDMHEMAGAIIAKTGKRVIYYNADVDDEIKNGLNNVNEIWQNYDCVITNSVITCGVNYDLLGFDNCWLFFNQYAKPREMIQVSARIRHLESKTINAVYMGKMVNSQVYVDDRLQMQCPIYDGIYNLSINEDKSPKRKSFEYFCTKAGYKMLKTSAEINGEICQEVSKLFGESQCIITYDTLYDLVGQKYWINEIEESIMNHTATLMDKLSLKKYYFANKFLDTANQKDIAYLWDQEMTDLFNKLTYLKTESGLKSVFWKIAKENDWEYVLPIATLEKKHSKLKISESIMNQIFQEFKFRSITKLSSKMLIYKHILNDFTNTQIIQSTYNKETKHTTFQIKFNMEEFMPTIRDLINNHLHN